jgi:hypothetical protein
MWLTVLSTMLALQLFSNASHARPGAEGKTEKRDSLYFLGKFSVTIPSESTDTITSSSVGIGSFSDSGKSAYGLRLIWAPNPPSNPLSSGDAVKVDSAWGPVFDYRYLINPQSGMVFYAATSLGFVYGVPSDESILKSEAEGREKPSNQILPILEFGIGLMITKKLDNNSELFISPEFGIIPGIGAPYASLSVGTNL